MPPLPRDDCVHISGDLLGSNSSRSASCGLLVCASSRSPGSVVLPCFGHEQPCSGLIFSPRAVLRPVGRLDPRRLNGHCGEGRSHGCVLVASSYVGRGPSLSMSELEVVS